MPTYLGCTFHGFSGLVKHFELFACLESLISALMVVVLLLLLAVADSLLAPFSGLLEQNTKTPPTLHLMPIDDQHVMIGCLF